MLECGDLHDLREEAALGIATTTAIATEMLMFEHGPLACCLMLL